MRAKLRVMHDGELRTFYELERITGVPNHTLRRRHREGKSLLDPGPGKGAQVRVLGETSIDPNLPYEQDEACQRLIAENPTGLGLAEIARLFNCSRERVRQLEAQALSKLLVGRSRNHVLHLIETADVLEKLRKPGVMDSAPDTMVTYRPSDKKAG
jgi:DNA-binding CsgD family transcriptional regulator